MQAMLAIVAGVLLVGQGLVSAGLWPRELVARIRARTTTPQGHAALAVLSQAAPSQSAGLPSSAGSSCLMSGMLGTFLRAPSLLHVLLAGVLTGFLPCGLVYGFLALAASSSSFSLGTLTMIAFGLGTVPLMVLAGSGLSLVSLATRTRLLRVAAACVILTGMISLARGVGVLDLAQRDLARHEAPPSCPLCR